MNSYEWGQWKEHTLIPSLWNNIDKIFPSMGFRLVSGGNKWISFHRLNGERTSQPDRTYITKNKPHLIGVNGGGEKATPIIDLYMERNGKDFFSAIKELASLCGVPFPDTDSEEWKEYEQTQKNRETANDLFKAALFSDDEGAREVLRYLEERVWSKEEIKEAELGYIDEATRKKLPDNSGFWTKFPDGDEIAATHRLIFPYRNGTRLLGFKARNIRYGEAERQSKRRKYLNTKGLQRIGLFGLLPIGEDCIIVEGELDALHVKAKAAIMNATAKSILKEDKGNEEAKQMIALADRMQGIAATIGGGGLTPDMIGEAKKRGYKRYTLLFDNDEAGRKYTTEALSNLEQCNMEAWVAELPEDVKDVDEYLAKHTLGELSQIVEEALPSYVWKLHQLSLSYWQRSQTETPTRKEEEDYLKEVEKIINSPQMLERPLARARIKEYIRDNEEALKIKLSDVEAWIDQAYNRYEATKRRAEASSAATQIKSLMDEGKVDEAITLMGETAKTLKTRDKSAEYASIFAPLGLTEFETLLSTIPQGIPTGYKIGKEELTLQAGLTFICGATSHGKSSFLNSLLLNVAKWNKAKGEGKSVLYFSYEIDKRRLIADLINAYVGDPELDARAATDAPNNSPLSAIYPFFEYKAKGMIEEARRKFNPNGNHYNGFINGYLELQREYFSTGEICVVEKNYLLEELLNAIRYYLTLYKPSAIFIDYAQLIYKEGQSRQRTEEIKDIVTEIKTFANENGLPIVMAAQFNRSVVNPLDVLTKNIGEAGDLERVADTIVGMFNLSRPIVVSKDEKDSYRQLLNPLLRRRGEAEIGASDAIDSIPNRMYLALLKRRNSLPDQRAILEWEGRIKTIKANFPQALKFNPEQGSLFPDTPTEEDCPF